MIQVVNTTSATLAAGATIPPGNVQVRTNNRVNLTWVTSAAGTLINASETVSRIV